MVCTERPLTYLVGLIQCVNIIDIIHSMHNCFDVFHLLLKMIDHLILFFPKFHSRGIDLLLNRTE